MKSSLLKCFKSSQLFLFHFRNVIIITYVRFRNSIFRIINQLIKMNIRKIIGFGFVAAMVGCQDQAGGVGGKACLYHPQAGSGLGSSIVVKTIEKPQPKAQVPKPANCEQKRRWTTQKGEPHETQQVKDDRGIHHNTHKWKNEKGEEHKTDQWVEKDGSVHSQHIWVNQKGQAHRTVHITTKDGKIVITHEKKDKDGKVTKVDDKDRSRSRSRPRKGLGSRSRSRSQSQSRSRSGSRSRLGSRPRLQSRSRSQGRGDRSQSRGRGESRDRRQRPQSQDRSRLRSLSRGKNDKDCQQRNEDKSRQHSNEGLHLGQERREGVSRNRPHLWQHQEVSKGRDQGNSRQEGRREGQSRGRSNQGRFNEGHQHGPVNPQPQVPPVVILPPPNCSNLRAH